MGQGPLREGAPQEMQVRFAKVFVFRPTAIVPYLLACAAVTLIMGFFLWVFAQWELLTLAVFCLLSVPIALTAAWTLYLWMVVRTATLLVTEQGIVYRDRWVRRALLWNEVAAITPFAIRSKKGRSIALRPGVKALNNWQELLAIARELSDAAIRI